MNVLESIKLIKEETEEAKPLPPKRLQSKSGDVGAEIGRGLGHAAGAAGKAVGATAKFAAQKIRGKRGK
jgi:hypothetical protein